MTTVPYVTRLNPNSLIRSLLACLLTDATKIQTAFIGSFWWIYSLKFDKSPSSSSLQKEFIFRLHTFFRKTKKRTHLSKFWHWFLVFNELHHHHPWLHLHKRVPPTVSPCFPTILALVFEVHTRIGRATGSRTTVRAVTAAMRPPSAQTTTTLARELYSVHRAPLSWTWSVEVSAKHKQVCRRCCCGARNKAFFWWKFAAFFLPSF